MELSLGEVTSHKDAISAIGFFSSVEMFLAMKKVKCQLFTLRSSAISHTSVITLASI